MSMSVITSDLGPMPLPGSIDIQQSQWPTSGPGGLQSNGISYFDITCSFQDPMLASLQAL